MHQENISNTANCDLKMSSSNMAKRKMPDTMFNMTHSPSAKTQVYSSEYLDNQMLHQAKSHRVSHHTHTASLPVEVPPMLNMIPQQPQQPMGAMTSSSSMNNVYNPFQNQHIPLQTQQAYSSFNPNFQNKHLKNVFNPSQVPSTATNSSNHSKTFSLPVTFDASNLVHHQQLQPPVNNGFCGEIPLPEGWEMQKTPTGKAYYINHLTKTTTWDDPRKMYNLPTNQNDMNVELKAKIVSTIPLPHGWEEARTPQGEVYFINHTDRTTTWHDPRINIYMQQQQQQQPSNFNAQFAKENAYNYGNNQMGLLNAPSSTASSYMSSPSASSLYSSSSSSISSLNGNQVKYTVDPYSRQPMNQIQPISANIPAQTQDNTNVHPQPSLNNKSFELKQSLDQVLKQKADICFQLEQLSKKEILLKSKLSPSDLDDILKMLKTQDAKMSSFAKYENRLSTNSTSSSSSGTNEPTNEQAQGNQPLPVESTIETLNANTELNGDMDSTLIGGDSSVNLNTSTTA